MILSKLPSILFFQKYRRVLFLCTYLPFRHSLQCKYAFPMHCYLLSCFCLFCFPSLGGNILTVSCKQKAKQNGAAKKYQYIKLRRISITLFIAYHVKSGLLNEVLFCAVLSCRSVLLIWTLKCFTLNCVTL